MCVGGGCLLLLTVMNFFSPLLIDQVHSIPVQQMGNYQEYLKKMPASLREIETQPARLHMFGNPFKVNKVSQLNLSPSRIRKG